MQNSVDPQTTPRSVVSDLDLHCFSMSHLWDASTYGLKGLLDIEHNTAPRTFCCFILFNVCRACNYKAAEHLYK